MEMSSQERVINLEKRVEQLRQLALHLSLAEQRERKRLADMLHDSLQQVLVAAKMQMNIAVKQVHEERAKEWIQQTSELIDESIAVSRSLCAELFPPILQTSGMRPAIEWLARYFHEKHQHRVIVQGDIRNELIDQETRFILFFALRELLLNSLQYSGVKSTTIHLSVDEHQGNVFTVMDHGRGFDVDEPTLGYGLMNMGERLKSIGAYFNVQSSPRKGTRITIICPPSMAQGVDHATRHPDGATKFAAAQSRTGERIRILLADDHAIVRQGLKSMLEEETDFAIIGEAGDGVEAVKLTEELHPEIVLMDINMPRMDGLQATRRIRQLHPEVQVVALSVNDDGEMLRQMERAGACAYITKGGAVDELFSVLHSAAAR